jgi:uncharacterized protein (DUF433 family)
LTVPATTEQRQLILEALRHRRGRYNAQRAAQLSGVPERTVYEWATRRVLVPDYAAASPKQWSYRDLVYLRALAWMRSAGMERNRAAERVAFIRARMTNATGGVPLLHTDGRVLLWADGTDEITGEQIFGGLEWLVRHFDLLDPVDDISGERMWGPNLVHPSARTVISPWVLAGEPCVRGTRIPTTSLLALRRERGLSPKGIVRLYPGLDVADVDDAVALETRLRGAA